MAKYPGETGVLYFEIRRTSDNELVTPDSFNIRVRDPSQSTRIVYNASLLVEDSTGVYRYTFQVPSRVLPGEWHIEVQSTVGSYTAVERVNFGVLE